MSSFSSKPCLSQKAFESSIEVCTCTKTHLKIGDGGVDGTAFVGSVALPLPLSFLSLAAFDAVVAAAGAGVAGACRAASDASVAFL